MKRLGALGAGVLWGALAAAGNAAGAGEAARLTIGYLEIAGDARYEDRRAYAGIHLRPRGRPFDGARMAVRESRILSRALKVRFGLERAAGKSAADLVAAIERLGSEKGVRFFIIDAAADVLSRVALGTRGKDVLLFNVSEPADGLRGSECQAHLMHVLANRAMLMDALVQYIVSKGWRDVLVLKGPLPEDAALAQALARAAKRMGARIVGVKDFVLSNNPRERGKNNVALLTSETDHDVVFLADTDGEFGRYVPFQTSRPRPVIGTEGMIADTWHWSWERHGAPQLNQRFEKRAKRKMRGADWAAWAAVKSIVESVARTRSTDFATVTAYLRSGKLTLDGYKGTPVNFRPWDNQLRQPILLRTHNAIVARAPVKGFLHPTNNLDTLGFDRGDTRCRF